MTSQKTKIFIVTGVTASLGAAFIEHFSQQEDALCFGLFHSDRALTDTGNLKWRQCDLLDPASIGIVMDEVADAVVGHGVSNVNLVHAVGPFAYEGHKTEFVEYWRSVDSWNGLLPIGVDRNIWARNFDTFHNAADGLLRAFKNRRNTSNGQFPKNLNVTIGTFGSLTEKHRVPLWYSFILARQAVFCQLRQLACMAQETYGITVGGFYLRTSTIDTGSERGLRPRASERTRRHWLKPDAIVQRATGLLSAAQSGSVVEGELYDHHPDFYDGYYSDPDAIRRKWESEIGGPVCS